MTKHNRRYKDSVFVDLFGEDKNAKANFLSLYNALHGTSLDATTKLESLRLEQVMYMAFRNDVTCLVDDKIIVLVEHQSTVNANMPLRFLQYAARLYERIQNPHDRYLRRLKKIPTPEFYVFYNGEEDYPETATLRLSDAFITISENPTLELVVSVTNINYNKNYEIKANGAAPSLRTRRTAHRQNIHQTQRKLKPLSAESERNFSRYRFY